MARRGEGGDEPIEAPETAGRDSWLEGSQLLVSGFDPLTPKLAQVGLHKNCPPIGAEGAQPYKAFRGSASF